MTTLETRQGSMYVDDVSKSEQVNRCPSCRELWPTGDVEVWPPEGARPVLCELCRPEPEIDFEAVIRNYVATQEIEWSPLADEDTFGTEAWIQKSIAVAKATAEEIQQEKNRAREEKRKIREEQTNRKEQERQAEVMRRRRASIEESIEETLSEILPPNRKKPPFQ